MCFPSQKRRPSDEAADERSQKRAKTGDKKEMKTESEKDKRPEDDTEDCDNGKEVKESDSEESSASTDWESDEEEEGEEEEEEGSDGEGEGDPKVFKIVVIDSGQEESTKSCLEALSGRFKHASDRTLVKMAKKIVETHGMDWTGRYKSITVSFDENRGVDGEDPSQIISTITAPDGLVFFCSLFRCCLVPLLFIALFCFFL
jgi:hypothetical protein